MAKRRKKPGFFEILRHVPREAASLAGKGASRITRAAKRRLGKAIDLAPGLTGGGPTKSQSKMLRSIRRRKRTRDFLRSQRSKK